MHSLIQQIFLFLALICLAQGASMCPNAKGKLNSVLPDPQQGEYSIFIWGNDLFKADTLLNTNVNCLINTKKYSTIGLFVGFSSFSSYNFYPMYYSVNVINAFFNNKLKKEIMLYVNFNETSEQAINAYVQDRLSPFIANKTLINKVWVRTNIDPNCPKPSNYVNCQVLSVPENHQILNTALTAVTNLGFQAGIYTNEGIWELAFDVGSSKKAKRKLKDLGDFPLMYDDSDYSDVEPSYKKYQPIGPWDYPAAKMSGYWYIDETCCWPGQVVWTKNTTFSATQKTQTQREYINDF